VPVSGRAAAPMSAAAYGAMGTRVPASAALAALTVKPRVQGTGVANGGAGARPAWSPPR
jgi:hypothetical protein